jgi:hypothetical protein
MEEVVDKSLRIETNEKVVFVRVYRTRSRFRYEIHSSGPIGVGTFYTTASTKVPRQCTTTFQPR